MQACRICMCSMLAFVFLYLQLTILIQNSEVTHGTVTSSQCKHIYTQPIVLYCLDIDTHACSLVISSMMSFFLCIGLPLKYTHLTLKPPEPKASVGFVPYMAVVHNVRPAGHIRPATSPGVARDVQIIRKITISETEPSIQRIAKVAHLIN